LNRLNPGEAIFAVQKNGWIDEELMLKWIESVWAPYVSTKSSICVLLLDACSAHFAPSVSSKFAELGTLVIPLPPGETSKVQVLDVGVNKPFKDLTTERLTRHVVSSNEKVTRDVMARILLESWSLIKEETIVKTFQKIGLIK
jgi:hypothetical protein